MPSRVCWLSALLRLPLVRGKLPWLLLCAGLWLSPTPAARAAGTWSPLNHAPPAGLNNALLLGDGTVVCGDGGNGWYRLTPDNHGSYVNGTWSPVAASQYTRLFYSAQVMTNGNLYVAGGEYGSGAAQAEVFNPLKNAWTEVPQPGANPTYIDAISKMLPSGQVLQGTPGNGVWLYNPNQNTITAAANAIGGQDEACWVKLANDNILTIDAFGQNSEHYVPSLNQWVSDGTTPQDLYGYGGELGPGFLLPNGNVFFIGASSHTGIYTPGATASASGSWISGPEMVFNGTALGAVDAPGAMLVNGKILCALGPTNGYNGPTYFYEYDYTVNAFTQVSGPSGVTLGSAPFVMSMLDLPDGNVLFISGQGTTQLYVYFPDGTPLAAGQPVINSITQNSDGSYQMTGLRLNGLSTGAAYGDDWQTDSNYPMVRLTNSATGLVYYARTYGWNSTSVMTQQKVITTQFALPVGLPAGTYSLVVSANGNPSLPQTFTYAPPAAPTGLTAVLGNGQAALSWNPVAGAGTYVVARANALGANYLSLATLTGTNYTDSALTNSTTYYYVVTAVAAGGPSAYSIPLAVMPFGPPAVPTGLAGGPDNYVGVNLGWNVSPGATNYNVKRANSSGGPFLTQAARAATDFTDTIVAAGTTYYYQVSAVGPGGESANSATLAVTPAATGEVTTGLLANWRCDEGTGTTTADAAAGHSGSLINGPTWVAPGRIGAGALNFAAANSQYVNVANATALNPAAGLTITAWLNAVDWGGNRRILQKGNSDNEYRLLAENGALKFHPNGVGTLTTALPATNTWVHVAATWNGATMAIYVNGVLQASQAATGSITSTADPLAIGTKYGSTAAGDYFNGNLDEVRVYNRGLSAVEINSVLHAGDAPLSTPTNVRAVAGNGQIFLSWTGSAGASSYNVQRATSTAGPWVTAGAPFGPAYTDAGLTNGIAYYYMVSAVNAASQTANSGLVFARPAVGVTFFTGANYTGTASTEFAAGNYPLASLSANGAANDAAAACRIPPGWTVVVYQNDNYGGAAWPLTGDTPNFAVWSGLNANMSSCKITTGSTPLAPGGVVALATNATVSVTWTPANNALSYNIKRATNSSGPYVPLGATTTTRYTDATAANGTTYFYELAAVNTNGAGAFSTVVSATPLAPPAAPAGLVATPGDTQVQLAWAAAANATAYNVRRATNSGGPYSFAGSTAASNYTDTGLVDGATYYYVVSAYNVGGQSTNSLEVSATPEPPPPAAPAGLTALPGDGQIALAWTADAGALGYNLRRGTNSGGPYTLVAMQTATTYADVGLFDGTNYFYVVSALGPGGESPYSAEVSAIPVAPAPVPVQLSGGGWSNGQFSLQFAGQDGHTYVLQVSTDLMNWTALGTNVQTGGLTVFTDANATDAARFYRIEQ